MTMSRRTLWAIAIFHFIATGAAILWFLFMAVAHAQSQKPPKVFPGPYAADVVRVVDADTIEANVHLWPNQITRLAVRVFGVDTPEKRRPKCALEKEKAIAASTLVERLLPVGSRVTITDVQNGKFAGRVVAKVSFKTATGQDSIGDMLTRRGMAVPYFGRKKTKDWCVGTR